MVAGRVEWSDLDGLVAAGQVRGASNGGGPVVCDVAAAGQYALELAWVGEALVRAAGLRPVEGDALPSFLRVTGAAGGRYIASATRDPAIFGGGERLVMSQAKTGRGLQNAAQLEAVKLHYLAIQRVIRQLVRGSRSTSSPANVTLLRRPPGELPKVPPGPAASIPGIAAAIPGVIAGAMTPGPGGVTMLPGAIPGAPTVVLPLAGLDDELEQLEQLGAVAFGSARSGLSEDGGLSVAAVVLIGVLGSAALAAGAWVVAQVHGQNVELATAKAKIAEQARVACEIAAAKIAAGQPVDVPEVVRSLGVSEERAIKWTPWAAGALGLATGVAATYAATRGAR